MNQNILDYLKTQRVCVLAVQMPDGSPHAATLHFASSDDGSRFFLLTSPGYRKAEAIRDGKVSPASLVIGTSEGDMKTLQLDGVVRLVNTDEQQLFNEIYYKALPEKQGKFPDGMAFVFLPTWWRFTDWTTPQGKTIICSEDK